MNAQSAALHRHTPRLNVIDPRGLAIRTIGFCRTQPSDIPELRLNRVAHDDAGRAVRCWDARLWETQAAVNLATVFSLGGQALLSDSVDAGWRLVLAAEGGEVLASWDGNGNERKVQYDSLRRPVAIVENDRCVERLQYGGPDAEGHNQCGRCVRHDDTAGTRMDTAFALTGGVLEQTRHFLAEPDGPEWPEPQAERDALLETGAGALTRWAYGALGDVIRQTDAQGNVQAFAHNVLGKLETVSLGLGGQSEQTLAHSIGYDPQGRVTCETAGNGVVTEALYDLANGRLIELKATRGGGELLQHLLYDYDPVGNVLRIEDAAQPTRFFANQRLEPVSTYQYDTLYQLIQATGTEAATVNHGPAFQSFQSSVDPAQLANYTQTYRYDASGNLQQLTHVGAQSHSRTLITSQTSNRSLPVINDQPPDEAAIGDAFDANGNLRELQAGQAMSWDRRNQLQQVRPVVRQSGEDDSERYVYDASGQRLRKIRQTQAKAVIHTAEVRYLPGLEVRTNSATGETLHVIVSQAGRSEVRVLHWQAGKPEELENDQARYSFNDHLGSATLELDKDARLISQESYYPYGGTSWWAGRSVIEASYKTVRYSGKERDATGLYYYGLRYYAPWLQRWINPDPAGAVDGLNMFCFTRNSPAGGIDKAGMVYQGMNDRVEKSVGKDYEIGYRGTSEMEVAGEYPLLFTLDVTVETSVEHMTVQMNRLKNNDPGALLEFLGDTQVSMNALKPVMDKIVSGYDKLITSAKRYGKDGDLREQIVTVMKKGYGKSDAIAFVYPNDSKKRLFLTGGFRGQAVPDKIGTFIHELSHLELATNDDFYYDKSHVEPDADSDAMAVSARWHKLSVINENVTRRASYKPLMHGFKSFEMWLTNVADFWGNYIQVQMASHDSLTGLSVDRFTEASRRRNDSSYNKQRRRTESFSD